MKREILIIALVLMALPAFSDNEQNDGKFISGRTYYNKSMDNSTWTNSKLTSINWNKSSLNSADFSNANIKDSYFESTDLSGANFSNATLSNVDFSNSNLNGIFDSLYWDKAPTKYTNLSGVKGLTAENLKSAQLSLSTYQPAWGKLCGVIFNGNDMSNWDLSDYAFYRCKFEGVNFSNAKLKELSYSDLTNANFSGVDFSNLNIYESIIKGVNFSEGVARGLTFSQIRETKSWSTNRDLSGINFSSNKLENWNFYNMNLSNSDLSNCTFVNNVDEHGFHDSRKYEDFLTLTNFSGANLTNANFTNAHIKDTNFSNATLTSVNFFDTKFEGENNFTDAKIAGTASNWSDLRASGFTEENFKSTATFKNSNGNIKYISFGAMSGWDMSNLNFEDCEIRADSTDFSNSTFKNCKYFFGAWGNYTNASFRGENLANANFMGSVYNTDFTDCDISGAYFCTRYDFTKAQLESTKSYKDGNLKGLRLMGSNVNGWNFSNIDLTDASFYKSSVSNANFENAIIKNVDFSYTDLTKEQFESTKSYATRDLGAINLTGHNLRGWDFSNQNMVYSTEWKVDGATFTNSDLTGADFTNANVSYSDFSGTNLSEKQFNSFANHTFCRGSNFTDVDMREWAINKSVKFLGAGLRNTSFKHTTFSNITIEGGVSQTGFPNYSIENVDFTGAKINVPDGFLKFSKVEIKNSSFISMNASSKQILIQNFTTFLNCDFRGSNFDSAMFNDDKSIFGYNIIWTDGVLKKKMGSKAYSGSLNSFMIRKFEGAKLIPVKICESDFKISNLIFEEGGILEVSNRKTLTTDSISMDTSLDGSSMLYIGDDSGLTVKKLTVNITEDISANDVYTLAVIEWESTSRMTGISDFVMDENLFLNVKGNKYKGYWEFGINDNQLIITIGQVPEPAAYAAIFGLLALGVVVRRNFKRR